MDLNDYHITISEVDDLITISMVFQDGEVTHKTQRFVQGINTSWDQFGIDKKILIHMVHLTPSNGSELPEDLTKHMKDGYKQLHKYIVDNSDKIEGFDILAKHTSVATEPSPQLVST